MFIANFIDKRLKAEQNVQNITQHNLIITLHTCIILVYQR